MEARAQEHDRIVRNALNAADFQRFSVDSCYSLSSMASRMTCCFASSSQPFVCSLNRIQVVDGPFCRRFMPPMEMVHSQSNHANHLKMMESRQLRNVHDAWEAVKDDERRMRARKLFRPLEVAAIPEIPYHRAYRRPTLYDP